MGKHEECVGGFRSDVVYNQGWSDSRALSGAH